MLLMLLACTGPDPIGNDSDTGLIGDFCTTFSEANTSEQGTADGSVSGSGHVQGRFIQGVVSDPFDPSYVGFVDYLIDNLDVGGTSILGRSDGEGRFTATLGPGNWKIKTSVQQGSYHCASDYSFAIAEGRVTRICVDLNCL